MRFHPCIKWNVFFRYKKKSYIIWYLGIRIELNFWFGSDPPHSLVILISLVTVICPASNVSSVLCRLEDLICTFRDVSC